MEHSQMTQLANTIQGAKSAVIAFEPKTDTSPFKAGVVKTEYLHLVEGQAQNVKTRILQVTVSEYPDLIKQLPLARIESDGTILLATIAEPLREKIMALEVAKNGEIAKIHDTPNSMAEVISGRPVTASGPVTDSSEENINVPVATQLWEKLKVGDLVLTIETTELGWWAAKILKLEGNSYTLEYRDYPEDGRFTRVRTQIALLHPQVSKIE
jgi:hypothetical protein